MKRQRPEDALQKSMVQFLESSVPPPPAGPWWTASNPDPGRTSIIKAARWKAMGLKAGTPDLIMCFRCRFIGIEVKPPYRYLSKVQKEVHAEIDLAGGVTHTVRSVDELQAILLVLGVPVHGRIAA